MVEMREDLVLNVHYHTSIVQLFDVSIIESVGVLTVIAPNTPTITSTVDRRFFHLSKDHAFRQIVRYIFPLFPIKSPIAVRI